MTAKTEERLKEVMPLLPTKAPAGLIDDAEMRGLITGEAMVFRMEWRPGTNGRKEKKVRLMCSACGGNTYLQYVKLDDAECGRTCGYSYGWQGTYGFKLDGDDKVYVHNNTCVCPLCGYGGTVYLGSKINYATRIDSCNMLSVHNFDGVFGLLGWYIAKYIDKEGKTFINASGTDGVLVLKNTAVRVKKYAWIFSSEKTLVEWEYKKTFAFDISAVPPNCYFGLSKKMIEQTTADRSGLYEYVKNGGKYPVKFLRSWQKYPQVENLAVQGYTKVLDELMNDYTFSPYMLSQKLNMKERSPDKILGIEKSERWVAREFDYRALSFYKRIRDRYKVWLNMEQMLVVKNSGVYGIELLVNEGIRGHKVKILHLIGYLQNQQQTATVSVNTNYLNDYWGMVFKLYGSIPSELLWPKNLQTAHDEVQKQIAWKTEQELAAGFEEQEKKYGAFAFSDDETGLMIRVCHDQAEMIAEGKTLTHCVASYADSHAKGTTTIFFIRKIKEPDTPFFTLEWKNERINQNLGMKNLKTPQNTPIVGEFEKRWLEYLKTINIKDEKNGKRSRSKAEQRAGA